MTLFRTWLFGIVAAAMALALLYALVPKGALLTVAKCTGGLIMLLVVIRPLLAAVGLFFCIAYLVSSSYNPFLYFRF